MASKARALLLSSHPGPSVVVSVVALLLGVALGYPGWRVVLLTATILSGQLSIGWSNDWIDAHRDASVHRSDKPVATGEITKSLVRTSAFVALALTVALSLFLGSWAAVANLAVFSMGWLYNLGLKNAPISVLPFIVSFGALPAVATLGQESPRLAAPWVLAVGALLGVAAHLTNVLPDLEDDRATGVRGFPHLIGARPSGILAFACLLSASALIAFSPDGPARFVPTVGLAASLVLAVVGVVLVLVGRRTRLLMRLIMAGAIVDVAMLVLSGQSLSG